MTFPPNGCSLMQAVKQELDMDLEDLYETPMVAAEMEAEEVEFKPELFLLLDGKVPSTWTIDDWEHELEKSGAIVNDIFIGYTSRRVVKEQCSSGGPTVAPRLRRPPRSVVFVGSAEGDQIVGTSFFSPHFATHFYPSQSQLSFYEAANVQSSSQPDVSSQFALPDQPPPDPYSESSVPIASIVYEPLSVRSAYNEADEDVWSMDENLSSTFDSSSSSPKSQHEILEEIQRECAEIELSRSSASPPEIYTGRPSASRRSGRRSLSIARPSISKAAARPSSSRSAHSLPFSSGTPQAGDRKKELNRIAATRYREKRRKEKESTSDELRALEARHVELLSETASIDAELSYLKNLIREIESRAAM